MKRRQEEYIEETFNDNMFGVITELNGLVDGYEIKMEEMEYAIKWIKNERQRDKIA